MSNPPIRTLPRLTFARAIADTYTPETKPWVYGVGTTHGGHELDVAHCIPECSSSSSCTCEEISHLTWQQLTDVYLLAREHGALCHTDIETFCAEDTDALLQVALYGALIFS